MVVPSCTDRATSRKESLDITHGPCATAHGRAPAQIEPRTDATRPVRGSDLAQLARNQESRKDRDFPNLGLTCLSQVLHPKAAQTSINTPKPPPMQRIECY